MAGSVGTRRDPARLRNDTKFCIFCCVHSGSRGFGRADRAKAVVFRGGSLDDLRAFPNAVRRAAGHQIDRVQLGREPDDWKPMPTVGPGVREIRIREADGAFRVIYVAKFADAIFVLHCFSKTTQKTSRGDIAVAKQRYAQLIGEMHR